MRDLNEPTFERGIWYEYTTTCPSCGIKRARGRWNRPDVCYDDCPCGYVGALAVKVAEVEVYLPREEVKTEDVKMSEAIDAQAVVDELDVIILGLVQAADQMSALRTERGVMTILPEAHVASLENEVSVLLQTRNFFIDICALSGNFTVGSDLTFRGEDHSYSASPTPSVTPPPHPAAQTPAS